MAAVGGANWACDISRDTSVEKHNGNDSIATQCTQAICYCLTAATHARTQAQTHTHIVADGDQSDFQLLRTCNCSETASKSWERICVFPYGGRLEETQSRGILGFRCSWRVKGHELDSLEKHYKYCCFHSEHHYNPPHTQTPHTTNHYNM